MVTTTRSVIMHLYFELSLTAKGPPVMCLKYSCFKIIIIISKMNTCSIYVCICADCKTKKLRADFKIK